MAFPPAHMLVGAGVAELVRSAAPPLPRWRAWAAGAALGVAPDLDFLLGIALGRAGAYHGTFTHSITATVVVGLVIGVLAGRRWGVLAAASYGSHLLVDLLDDRGRTNVLLGWPFTDERPFAIARVFPQVPFNLRFGFRDPYLPLEAMAGPLALQTLIGLLFLLGLLALAWLVRRARRRTS